MYYSTGSLSDFSTGAGLVVAKVPPSGTKGSVSKQDGRSVVNTTGLREFATEAQAIKYIKSLGDGYKARIVSDAELLELNKTAWRVASPHAPGGNGALMFANKAGLKSLLRDMFSNGYQANVYKGPKKLTLAEVFAAAGIKDTKAWFSKLRKELH